MSTLGIMKILFVNHKRKACGIYQIGHRIGDFVGASKRYPIIYVEVDTAAGLAEAITTHQPRGIIYNFYPDTMPFIQADVTAEIAKRGIKQCVIIHDPMELKFIQVIESMFDAWIVHDETNPIYSAKKFMTCRPVPRAEPAPPPERFTIGSHGFGVGPWKDFDGIVEAVNNEFDEAIIRFNIGLAAFGDEKGEIAGKWLEKCRRKITKPGIELKITHDFMETEQDLIRFLQGNTVNMYFHKEIGHVAGPAGSADLAISSRRALVVNDNYMYRHISMELGGYGLGDKLKDLYRNEKEVERLYRQWSPEKIVADYDRMLDSVLGG
ncbi:MAG: hypothetical protein M3O30_02820 [Planctomycetota bacterium]|nr:hypothetical protein [Planctomycetota bacterium]